MYTGHVVGEGRGLLLLLLLLLLLSLLTNFDWDPMIDRITEERSEFFFFLRSTAERQFLGRGFLYFSSFCCNFFFIYLFFFVEIGRKDVETEKNSMRTCPFARGVAAQIIIGRKKKRIKKKTQHYHRYNIFSADCSFVFCCFSVVCFFFFRSFRPELLLLLLLLLKG